MGVQKNIGLLKAKNEQLTENLKKLILEETKNQRTGYRNIRDPKTYA